MKRFLPIIIVIVVLAVIFGGMYNGLVGQNEEVDSAWAQVENVLKKRADLIPNLVETVKGYAQHEEDIFIKVTEARSKVLNAKTPEEAAEANAELSRAIGDINVVVENYPELKANENFMALQAELSSIENELSTERMRYNDKVKVFNQDVKRFPKKIIASMFGFSPREYFQISEEDRETPKVDFNK